MKLFLAMLATVAAASAAEGQAPAKPPVPASSKTTAAKPAARPAAKPATKANDASKPQAIPAGAVADSAGDYHFTDPQGKNWIYRKTPFGVSRLEDTAEPVAAQARPSSAGGAGIVAVDQGDTVHFEKKGPFGTWKWEKKKTELDEGERAALLASQGNRQNAKQE